MEMKEDYYEILGIQTSSTQEEIKRAYRKSALKWHPDKNLDRRELAEANFKKLAEAYEVLSDPEKRQIYDRYGKEGLAQGGCDSDGPGFGFPGASFFGSGGFNPFGGLFFNFRDPNEVFRDLFGDSAPLNDFFSDNMSDGQHSFAGLQTNPQGTGGGFMDPFSIFGNFGGMSSMSMHMSSSSGGPNVKKISTSVKTVNGVRIETKKVIDNGVETVTVTENGRIKSKTVNGQAQLTN